MMNILALRARIQNDPVVAVVALALMGVAVAIIVEHSQLLPLEGQVMPMYGALPMPTVSRTVTAPAQPRKTAKRRTAPTTMHAAAPAQPTQITRLCALTRLCAVRPARERR